MTTVGVREKRMPLWFWGIVARLAQAGSNVTLLLTPLRYWWAHVEIVHLRYWHRPRFHRPDYQSVCEWYLYVGPLLLRKYKPLLRHNRWMD